MADPTPFYLKLLFGLGGRIAPRFAARAAAELVSRPRGRNPTQPWELGSVAAREVELRPGLYARTWGEQGPLVLGLHGWRGRPTQFRPLAEALAARGLRTIALDTPGHGRTKGERATPRILGELLIETTHIAGPAHAVVGHSFGGAAIGAALAMGLAASRVVLVSSPTHVSRMPFAYAREFGLPVRAMPHFARLLDHHAGRPIAELDLASVGPHSGTRALLVHDRGDAVIPYSDAEDLAAAWPSLRVMTTERLGHRDVLADAAVVRTIADFIVEDLR
ncbi:MAG TPA: alpha/beta fold hydrolase [Steroidobacteraceae bacterium]|nr:alpha/beta fold hydrolase [Steroidobacteraceae bacterium]